MKLSDKAALVSFEGLDEDEGPQDTALAGQPEAASAGQVAQPAPEQRPRTGVASITQRIELTHQVRDLQAQLDEFKDAQLVTKLDPKRVRQSRWKNRHELSYSTKEYEELKAEIEAAGGNVQPVKVRRVGPGADGQGEYEIVYGRRRLRACLELGLEVAAIVEELDDVQVFTEMERENRSRADLSPWEQGAMYKDALDAKLFSSQKHMAAVLNVSMGAVSMALSLASLPEEVVSAFPSPLDLQYRWAAEINKALEADTARVLSTARELAQRSPKLPAKAVLVALLAIEGGAKPQANTKQLKLGDRVVGSITTDTKTGLVLKLKAGALPASSERKLLDFVERLLG